MQKSLFQSYFRKMKVLVSLGCPLVRHLSMKNHVPENVKWSVLFSNNNLLKRLGK